MASSRFVIIAIFSIILPSIVLAMEYEVGDDQGWTTDFDYAKWAEDKVFYAGDTLVFRYTPPYHNVVKVDGSAFKTCTVPPAFGNNILTSGNDVVTLSAGRKWYICGVSDHCSLQGQKLFITVREGAAPAPAPTGAAHSLVPSSSIYLHALMAAIVALAVIMM